MPAMAALRENKWEGSEHGVPNKMMQTAGRLRHPPRIIGVRRLPVPTETTDSEGSRPVRLVSWCAWCGVAFALFVVGACGSSPKAQPVSLPHSAEELWAQGLEMERTYDERAMDLYYPDALIQNTRRYPMGYTRTVTVTVSQYRSLLKAMMLLARARGERQTYSNVRYAKEARGTRITATRYSELKRYSSPVSLLVAPDSSGVWRVLEDISESRP